MSSASTTEALRRDALACFRAAVRAVDPERLVRNYLGSAAGRAGASGRVWIAAIGKAAAAMTRGAVAVLGDAVAGG
ncbi:MAG: DUF4147 domain-containing protein, partial [Thermoanaerobaculia bacterium]